MENLFSAVIRLSIMGSYVILLILFARLLLKKAPKWISYALWLAAGWRLILPLSISNPLSLIPKRTENSLLVIDELVSTVIGERRVNRGTYEPISSFISEKTTASGWLDFIAKLETLNYVWLFMASGLLLYYLYSAVKIRRMLRSARSVQGMIYEADNIETPFVFGLISPRIYLPKDLRKEDREHILRHEEIHVRRKDPLIKAVSYLILCIHWFNPLVWIAFYTMSIDMELSCDEKVLLEKGVHNKKTYASSLLSMASPTVGYSKSQLAFGQVSVKTRIKNALNFKRPKFFMTFFSFIFAVTLGFGLITNPIEGSWFENVEAAVHKIENESTGGRYQVAHDEEKLHAYGVNYSGVIGSNSYNLLPKENVFDFELTRDPEILTAEIVFPSSEKDAIYFSVNISKGTVLHKTISETDLELSNITDEELIDIAVSMKRISRGVTDWDDKN